MLRPMEQWAGERYDLPMPPPTDVAIAIAKEEHEEAVAKAKALYDKRVVRPLSRVTTPNSKCLCSGALVLSTLIDEPLAPARRLATPLPCACVASACCLLPVHLAVGQASQGLAAVGPYVWRRGLWATGA